MGSANTKRERRRAAAIHAYVGSNGGGKSLAAVYDTIPSLRAGRPVLSTVRILDPETGQPHPLCEPLTHWRQLLDFRGGDVLLDEVQGVVSSRGHQSLPPAILNLLLQLRRRDVLCRWTSPDYGRADVVLRQVTQAVTYCRGYLAEPSRGCLPDCEDAHHDPYGCLEDCDDQHEHWPLRLWGANRLFRWKTFDALSFDEFTAGKRDQLRAEVAQFYIRSRDPDRAQDWYDTLDTVEHIRDADESGTCLTCGGSRRRPKCECDREHGPQRSEDRADRASRPAAAA